jgi:general secretion pathway protein I
MTRRIAQSRGFTLIEVMIALAILSVSLVVLAELNAGAIAMHSYAKKLNVATLLAKTKMLEVESFLDEKGLPAEGENISPSDGTFEEQGFPNYKWKVEVVAPKSENLDATKLMNMVMGGGDSAGGSKPEPGAAGAGLAGMLGGAMPGGGAGGLGGGLGGMLSGAIAPQAQLMITQITRMVREVRLTVSWMDGKVPQEFTVVEHIVSMGPSGAARTNQAQTTKDPNLNIPADD